jgi:hypothetical protein
VLCVSIVDVGLGFGVLILVPLIEVSKPFIFEAVKSLQPDPNYGHRDSSKKSRSPRFVTSSLHSPFAYWRVHSFRPPL